MGGPTDLRQEKQGPEDFHFRCALLQSYNCQCLKAFVRLSICQRFLSTLVTVLILSGCGLDVRDAPSPTSSQSQTTLLAEVTQRNRVSVVSDLSTRYVLQRSGELWQLKNTESQVISPLPSGTTRIRFLDITIALPGDDGVAQIYRLYQAASKRLPDADGMGFWLAAMERGIPLNSVAEAFLSSAEFQSTYGANVGVDAYVKSLYNNVLHRQPEPSGLSFWVKALNDGATRANLLVWFADSDENKLYTDSAINAGIRLAELGVDYAPVANAGADQSTSPTGLVTLDGKNSTDARKLALAFRWELVVPSGSRTILFQETTSAPRFTPDIPGRYIAKLTLHNGILSSFEADTVEINVTAAVPAASINPPLSISDTGIYKCSTLSTTSVVTLYAAGHRYLDRDNDGKPCEANDKAVEGTLATGSTGATGGGRTCWVNGYVRKNGTYVRGYYRSC